MCKNSKIENSFYKISIASRKSVNK